MAMKTCPECKNEISSNAKVCPHCGRKKKNIFWQIIKWSFLIFVGAPFLVGLLAAIFAERPTEEQIAEYNAEQNQQVAGEVSASEEEPTPPPKPESSWQTTTSEDEMSGEFSAYAMSKQVVPSPSMEFPYHDVTARIAMGCNSKGSEWAYLYITGGTNLANTETESGYNWFQTRVKWDDDLKTMRFTQDWGADFVHFSDDKTAIAKMQAANTVKIEMQWHSQRPTYFTIPLNGSSAAIAEIRQKCAKN